MTDEAKAARNAYQRSLTARDPEKHREYMRKWRKEHRAHIAAYRRKWHAEHPEKNKEYQRRHWEKKAAEAKERTR